MPEPEKTEPVVPDPVQLQKDLDAAQKDLAATKGNLSARDKSMQAILDAAGVKSPDDVVRAFKERSNAAEDEPKPKAKVGADETALPPRPRAEDFDTVEEFDAAVDVWRDKRQDLRLEANLNARDRARAEERLPEQAKSELKNLPEEWRAETEDWKKDWPEGVPPVSPADLLEGAVSGFAYRIFDLEDGAVPTEQQLANARATLQRLILHGARAEITRQDALAEEERKKRGLAPTAARPGAQAPRTTEEPPKGLTDSERVQWVLDHET